MDILKDLLESFYNFSQDNFRNYDRSNVWFECLIGYAKSHCLKCLKELYKIYHFNNLPILPRHDNCRCYMSPLRKLFIGQATLAGNNGVDRYLNIYHKLPDNYITKAEAKKCGWKPFLGNLDIVAPGKVIGGEVFYNRQGKLPEKVGRIWYECDIDYVGGYRNNCRIIYSNDGLIFKTDSHYNRFISVEESL